VTYVVEYRRVDLNELLVAAQAEIEVALQRAACRKQLGNLIKIAGILAERIRRFEKTKDIETGCLLEETKVTLEALSLHG
jgi:hypothetical protein